MEEASIDEGGGVSSLAVQALRLSAGSRDDFWLVVTGSPGSYQRGIRGVAWMNNSQVPGLAEARQSVSHGAVREAKSDCPFQC